MAITALAIGTVASAGASVVGGIQAKKAGQKAADAQSAAADKNYALQKEYLNYLMGASGEYDERVGELMGESKATVEDAYNRIIGIISNIPSIETLYPRGEALSRKDFDFRTGIQRENLNFILGGTSDEAREIQQFNADLANLDEDAFTARFSKILDTSISGLKASTLGDPTGTFANLSAKNLYDFSQRGLSNYLAMNDFFSKEGTVDPISPYAVTQDLFSNAYNIAGLNINNEQWRASNLVSINNAGMGAAANSMNNAANIAQLGMNMGSQYFGAIADAQGARAAASTLGTQGVLQGIGVLTQGLSGVAALQMQQQALTQQQAFQNNLLNSYSLNSLNSFAPSTSVTSSTVSPTRVNPSSLNMPAGTGGLDASLFGY